MLAGRYRLEDVLGRGGMGKVWRAQDELLHRTVAVKELTAGLYVAEADRLVLHARTRKEARAAARISHPGVVTVHDVLDHDDRPWIVMQYVDGPSLADSTKENGESTPHEAARIGLGVLGALGAAHAAGVLHRDVKPGNVLLARDGQILLTDFGIAAIEGDSTITRTGELIGSIDYLAPERVQGHDPGPASDLWSLGATLYAAIDGRSPFRRSSPIATMQAVVTDEPSIPPSAGTLGPVIAALLCKDPAGRPSAAETERMLRSVLTGREPRTAQVYVDTRHYPGETRNETAPQATAGGTAAQATGPTAVRAGQTGRATGPTAPVGPGTAQSSPTHGHATPAGQPVTAPPTPGFGAPTPPAGLPYGTPPGTTTAATGPKPGSRRRNTVVAVVVAAVLGTGAGLGAMHFAGGGSGDDAAPPSPTLSARESATPGPSDGSSSGSSAGPSDAASPSDGTGGLADGPIPEGWKRVEDPAGFTIAVPEGWERRTEGTQIDYTPDEGGHRIRISLDPAPDFETPYTHMLEMEKNLRNRLPGYSRISLDENTFRDYPGSIWEFTWTETKDHPGERRGIDQMYFAGETGGPEYALYLTAPVDDWDDTRQLFDTMLRSWRPPASVE
ncbi:protein kinase [Streptomyces sp. NBC_00102]|uniref:protein kinase domain-containing protein n=1 Tax=Streptomyces sp. NBC_00102 TaxID=2975652 RepID=UPI00225734D7|nr:protein kinase [Streptomyces sp. NBC_00102]MCX5399197.1 protein kinase [Streptomyces sp. NBC_00102]